MFEIMFNDLKPEAQKEFLKYMGLKDASEGNYEFVPIATIEYNDDEDGDDEEKDADEVVCLANKDYTKEDDGCLLVDPKIDTFFDNTTVDVHTIDNLNHYTRYRIRADRGPNGEPIFEPTGYEYDDEFIRDVSSREVPCPYDCTECEYAYKCFENGRYDFEEKD